MQDHGAFIWTNEARRWFQGLSGPHAERTGAALDELAAHGRALGKPLVKPIKSSRHNNMKELRPRASNIRVLFADDPRGRMVVLVGGDKTNDWRGFYERSIPVADRLMDAHLRTMGGGERWQRGRTGDRSEPRVR